VPFGVTGLMKQHIFIGDGMRGNSRKLLSFQGWIGTKEAFIMFDDLDLKIYGDDTARYVVNTIKYDQASMTAY
jgi:hypothetical protein